MARRDPMWGGVLGAAPAALAVPSAPSASAAPTGDVQIVVSPQPLARLHPPTNNPKWIALGYNPRWPILGHDPKWQDFGYAPKWSGSQPPRFTMRVSVHPGRQACSAQVP